MSQFKDLYKTWIKDELESPEVQNAKEAFLKNFLEEAPAAPALWDKVLSAALNMSLVGAMALFILVKTGAFEPQPNIVLMPEKVRLAKVVEAIHNNPRGVTSKSWDENYNPIKIKKLSSQMGSTAVYSKPFPDAQVTVVWVFPKGDLL